MSLPDGLIEIDSDVGKQIGFTSDNFYSGSYMVKAQGYLWVNCIMARRRGRFAPMMQTIEKLGLAIKIPTPFRRMREIVEKNGYRQTFEYDDVLGEVEVWVKDPRPTTENRVPLRRQT